MRALVLDFDGVVSDSAAESFLVALRTRAELEPEGPSADAWARLGSDGVPTRARVEAHPLYPAFLEQMPLGTRAEDYAVSLAILERGERVADQAAFDAVKARLEPGELDAYHARFYAVRQRFSREDRSAWLALMAPYPELVALLRRRCGEVAYAIATAKDRATVAALLERYGIADLVPAGRLLDKDVGKTKRIHLERLRELLGVRFPEITFVDDKVTHLDAVAPLGVRRVLAAWGFNAERERVQARARGHLVCGLHDLEDRVFDS